VFETLDAKPFNPNVSLELGYMMALGKSTLLLKERNLPSMPADLTHRLYKEFDLLHVQETVEKQIAQWIEVDRAGER
jgi:nucleoside 2-deoxyribosyltransferase